MLSEGSRGLSGPTGEARQASTQPAETAKLVIPGASPLHFVGENDTHHALFDGTLVMAGTWRFRWRDDVHYEFVFTPDDASTLPYWPASAEPVAITFENPQAVLDTVMSRKARLGLRHRRQLDVYGRATITADRFTTAIDSQGNPLWQMRCCDLEIPQRPAEPPVRTWHA
jgi:hypothetical protein